MFVATSIERTNIDLAMVREIFIAEASVSSYRKRHRFLTRHSRKRQAGNHRNILPPAAYLSSANASRCQCESVRYEFVRYEFVRYEFVRNVAAYWAMKTKRNRS